jgi:hypothetical protein
VVGVVEVGGVVVGGFVVGGAVVGGAVVGGAVGLGIGSPQPVNIMLTTMMTTNGMIRNCFIFPPLNY